MFSVSSSLEVFGTSTSASRYLYVLVLFTTKLTINLSLQEGSLAPVPYAFKTLSSVGKNPKEKVSSTPDVSRPGVNPSLNYRLSLLRCPLLRALI